MVGSATRRIEAALFFSARLPPGPAKAMERGASVDLLVADLPASPCDVVVVAEGFLLRARPGYALPLKKR